MHVTRVIAHSLGASAGTLVVSAYAPCPDITATVTPDLKCPDGGGRLVWVSIGRSLDGRLGGSALAQCYRQVGDEVPDIDEPHLLVQAFNVLQGLLKGREALSVHDFVPLSVRDFVPLLLW